MLCPYFFLRETNAHADEGENVYFCLARILGYFTITVPAMSLPPAAP
jgi:hypothetical protein